MRVDVGADIESVCRKCGDVWHVIMAMMEGDIVKVQCKQCGGLHKYKDSSSTGAKAKDKPVKKRAPALTAAQKKAAAAAKPKGKATVAPNLKLPTKPYSFNDCFEPGQRIDHVKFGTGVVEDVIDGGKIEVYFPEGRKVLAIKKREAMLGTLKESRPAWLDDLGTSKTEKI